MPTFDDDMGRIMREEGRTTPPPLTTGYKANYQTLLNAVLNQDIALVSAIRKADQQPVALVAAAVWEGEECRVIPLAQMIEGDPYELYEDPTP